MRYLIVDGDYVTGVTLNISGGFGWGKRPLSQRREIVVVSSVALHGKSSTQGEESL
jgi:hypothetical protein